MLREQETTDALSGDIILCQLNLLLLLLLRETTAPTGGKLQTANAVHSENEIIRQAQQFISSHIREKLSVPLVARQVDVSPSYLTALFHKNLQISPGEYIRRIKLQESKQMIRENNLNFTEIAAELQYSTVHHFSRQFKEEMGENFSVYLTLYRLERAQELLNRTDLSIAEIANRVGYANPGYFTRIYKKYRGITPEQARMTRL